jgi:hypothetical protein
MLTTVLYEELGYSPHPVIHAYFEENPVLRWLNEGLGAVAGDGPEMAAAIARGEHVLVTPGGVREGCRPVTRRYQVDWGRRRGYLRMALRHGLPVVPVAAAGTDDAFIGLNDGYRWSKRLGLPHGLPAWVGIGMFGLWPFALPFPTKMHQIVGEPIDLQEDGPVDADDPDALEAMNGRVQAAVQDLLDRARAQLSQRRRWWRA